MPIKLVLISMHKKAQTSLNTKGLPYGSSDAARFISYDNFTISTQS
jgi:hypothetical protein